MSNIFPYSFNLFVCGFHKNGRGMYCKTDLDSGIFYCSKGAGSKVPSFKAQFNNLVMGEVDIKASRTAIPSA